jgi:radical SAM protein with 4Fe4S-binding SPASM domain
MLNAATAFNIERKSHWADHVQLIDGKPVFSWLDLSITDLCNRSAGHPRACVFCPRIDPGFYPNQKLHMALPLAEKIAEELHDMEYEGAVILCGFGEPLLHPQLEDLVRYFNPLRVEIVTNGDRLTPEKIRALVTAGVDYFVVSLYDGPHQVDKFNQMFGEAGFGTDRYGLRDRWHGADEDFGLKLTNRAGTVDAGNQPAVDASAACFYPSYELSIDWNGDALLCVQDWYKRVRFGNVQSQTLWEIWTSPAMHKRRMQLLRGRSETPCSGCNACGKMHGADHAAAWKA